MGDIIYGQLNIDNDKKISKVSSLIHGSFIEFMHNCINKGISVEFLENRKFFIPEDMEIAKNWFKTGIDSNCEYCLRQVDEKNGEHYQEIKVNGQHTKAGIFQKGFSLNSNTLFEVSIRLKTSSIDEKIEVSISSVDSESCVSHIIKNANDKWQTHKFTFNNAKSIKNATFSIMLHGTGITKIAEVSLKPKIHNSNMWGEFIESANSLNPTILRFPGGCFADTYNWQDGIGSKDLRTTKVNKHWGGIEDNDFGTDEYIELCNLINAQPFICVNYGSSNADDAAHWVEYCNGSIDTKMGMMRMKNGHRQPYNVNYWEVGNELYADWETGNCLVSDYCEKYHNYYKKMKEVDPNIKLIACGGDANSLSQEWNEEILTSIGDIIDFISLHFYSPIIEKQEYGEEELYYHIVSSTLHYEDVIGKLRDKIKDTCNSNVKIAVTEWNANYGNDSKREQTMEAAIFNASLFNAFLRNSDIVEICNFSDLINGWYGGCMQGEYGDISYTPSFHVLKLYHTSKLLYLLESFMDCDTYQSKIAFNGNEKYEVKYIDSVSCQDDEGNLIVFLVNKDLRRYANINLSIKNVKIRGNIHISELALEKKYNEVCLSDKINIIKDKTIKGKDFDDNVAVAPCSIVRLKIEL